MKRILFFLMLLVNLQLTTDNGSLSIGFGEVSAQRVMEEQLTKSVSAKAVTRAYDGYWVCMWCGVDYGSSSALNSHEPYCSDREEYCSKCDTWYKVIWGHVCDSYCPLCNKPLNECNCPDIEVIGKQPGGNNGGSTGGFDDDDDDWDDDDDIIGGASGSITNTSKWNYQKAIDWLNKNSRSFEKYKKLPDEEKGKCAKYVRQALKAAGIDTNGHPEYAKDYGNFLKKRGFYEISKNGYIPQAGDIRVWQPAPGTSKAGHIHIYDGYQWVSDFFEPNLEGPNAKYRKNPNYKIYRK